MADCIVEAFGALPADASADELANTVAANVASAAEVAGIDLSRPAHCPNASFAVFSRARRAVLAVGDCRFGWLGGDGRFAAQTPEFAVDRFTSSLRVAVTEFFREKGLDPLADGRDWGRDFIQPLLARQRELENVAPDDTTPWAFGLPRGVLSYRSILGGAEAVRIVTVPADATEAVLASDGFPQVFPTLEESRRELDRQLAEDPHCLGPLRSTKGRAPGAVSFDDMSYLRIKI